MSFLRRQTVLATAVLMLGIATSLRLAIAKKNKRDSAATQINEQKRVLHAINRLAFGPRPGEVERVTAMGVDKWIDQQLHPEKIDDHALDARLAPFRTLRMNTRELVENFPPPQTIKAIAEGKQPPPSEATRRAVYEAQLQRYQEKQDRKLEAANADPTAVAGTSNKICHDERRGTDSPPRGPPLRRPESGRSSGPATRPADEGDSEDVTGRSAFHGSFSPGQQA